MKIQLLRNPAKSLGCKLREGETGEVEDSLGKILVKSNLAVSLEPSPDTSMKAVPAAPAISEAKASDIAGHDFADEFSDTKAKSTAKSSVKSAVKSGDKPSGK